MTIFQPYSLTGSNPNGYSREHYAVRFGGCGGRVIGREWGLTSDQAQDLCWLLQEAFDLGAKRRALDLEFPKSRGKAA